jgi:hypothetical protein
LIDIPTTVTFNCPLTANAKRDAGKETAGCKRAKKNENLLEYSILQSIRKDGEVEKKTPEGV